MKRSKALQLRFDGIDGSRIFQHPLEILTASTTPEAFPALERAQEALQAGYAIAGFLSYEFGYVCVDLPNPYEARYSPLLLLGIFHPQRGVETPSESTVFRCTSEFVARISPSEYHAAIAEIHRLLFEGDLYQLNYSVPFDLSFTGEPAALYAQLGPQSRAPHRAFLQTPDYALVSLSPELFLRFQGDRLTMKPMKGTTSRQAEDALALPKNRAEHLMIVDLLRNDLGRICSEVIVEGLFTIERYPTFSTMTSTIHGQLRPQTSLSTIFRALFPCGSVTGAPKRSAIREIARLEKGPRGAYCGSIGYLLPCGEGSWNVAIRTLQLDTLQGCGRLDLGGGIVADSEGTAEWNEILVKGELFKELGVLTQRGVKPPSFEGGDIQHFSH